jgi:hypothetical protein
MRSGTIVDTVVAAAALAAGAAFVSCDRDRTAMNSGGTTSAGETSTAVRSSGSANDGDDANEDGNKNENESATPPEQVSGMFLACAFVDLDTKDAAKSNAIGCNAVDDKGDPVDIAGLKPAWAINGPSGSVPVSGDGATAPGYQLVFVLDSTAVQSGTATLTLTLADGTSVTLKKKLADVANAKPASSPGPTLTFQGKWTSVVAGCADDVDCNVLTGPSYCSGGQVRASMELEEGMELPAGVSGTIDVGAFAVNLASACVQIFRTSTTEITGNCYVVQLQINGSSALYIQSAAHSPLTYKQFDDYFSSADLRCP